MRYIYTCILMRHIFLVCRVKCWLEIIYHLKRLECQSRGRTDEKNQLCANRNLSARSVRIVSILSYRPWQAQSKFRHETLGADLFYRYRRWCPVKIWRKKGFLNLPREWFRSFLSLRRPTDKLIALFSSIAWFLKEPCLRCCLTPDHVASKAVFTTASRLHTMCERNGK